VPEKGEVIVWIMSLDCKAILLSVGKPDFRLNSPTCHLSGNVVSMKTETQGLKSSFIYTLRRIAGLLGGKMPWMEHKMFQVLNLLENVDGQY
jgi:hypothetical protein